MGNNNTAVVASESSGIYQPVAQGDTDNPKVPLVAPPPATTSVADVLRNPFSIVKYFGGTGVTTEKARKPATLSKPEREAYGAALGKAIAKLHAGRQRNTLKIKHYEQLGRDAKERKKPAEVRSCLNIIKKWDALNVIIWTTIETFEGLTASIEQGEINMTALSMLRTVVNVHKAMAQDTPEVATLDALMAEFEEVMGNVEEQAERLNDGMADTGVTGAYVTMEEMDSYFDTTSPATPVDKRHTHNNGTPPVPTPTPTPTPLVVRAAPSRKKIGLLDD